jgi:threonine efflux protein
MIDTLNLPIILAAGFISSASPGPATMAIAATSMAHGRKFGMAFAAGVSAGSLTWSVTAALGLSALMLANVWVFEAMRYFGALYLLYLAYCSAKGALGKQAAIKANAASGSLSTTFFKGMALHLTNPKPILFFSSLFAIGIPHGTPIATLFVVIAALAVQGVFIFQGFAFLFSLKGVAAGYKQLKRWFEGAFALAFGVASFKLLTVRFFD